MYLATLLSLVASFASVTKGNAVDPNENIEYAQLYAREAQIHPRDDIAFCFGTNSICAAQNRLSDKCVGLSNNADKAAYHRCRCENGYVSTEQACKWCQDAYNLSSIGGVGDILRANCMSYSASIAPIPSTIIDQQRSRNATWTGVLLGQATTASGRTTPSSIRATTTADSRTGTATSATRSTSIFGGRQAVTGTFNGGGEGTFAQPTVQAGNGGDSGVPVPTRSTSSSYAVVWSNKVGVLTSAIVVLVATMILL